MIGSCITDEIMHWMVESGLKALKIGIETGNDKWLKKVKKPTTKKGLLRCTSIFQKYPQVFTSGNFILGFPEETFSDMMDSYNFAVELSWDWISFYICQPLKGTEMFNAFADLGDDRCDSEGYGKTLNPGRSSARGEFGYQFEEENRILTGKEIFNLPPDFLPDSEQLKEIWFTFNLMGNFINNPNFKPGGNPEKMLRWFKSISDAYPYDASMVAGIAKCHKLMGNHDEHAAQVQRFDAILQDSSYWQRRVKEFPEIIELIQ